MGPETFVEPDDDPAFLGCVDRIIAGLVERHTARRLPDERATPSTLASVGRGKVLDPVGNSPPHRGTLSDSLCPGHPPNYSGAVTLSGQGGDDARNYQERQVKRAIEDVGR